MTEAEYVRSAMLALRDEFLAADTDAKLYYALTKLTCARRDGHLSRVRLVEGGIKPFAGYTQTGGAAPIKFKPDYTDRAAMFLFVSDFAKDIARLAGPSAGRAPSSATNSSASTASRPMPTSSASDSTSASPRTGRTGGTWPTAWRCVRVTCRPPFSTATA